MYIAEADGSWIGMAGCKRDGPKAHVIAMWVAPSYRGQGLGRRLVERVADWAREGGAGGLQLCVTEGNAAAVALYRQCGFQETEETEPLRSHPELLVRTMVRGV